MIAYVSSFGYGHAPPPAGAHLTFDVRHLFRDPHVSPELRQLTGQHERVVDSVMAQEGAYATAYHLADIVRDHERRKVPFHLAIGCVGGRHRSVVLANAVAALAGVAATHRDIDKPVLQRHDAP